MKVKCDHRSKFSNLSNWKEETWKKIRASTGFEPLTYAIPVRCSTNWPMKPHTGSEVNLLRSCLLRSLSPQIFHSHFVIRILSSAFFYPPSAAIRSVLYRDPPETAWKKKPSQRKSGINSTALKHSFQLYINDSSIFLPLTFLFLRPISPSSRMAVW